MLADKILSAKSGNKDDMLCLIEKFSPVIKKYGKKYKIMQILHGVNATSHLGYS